VTADASSSRHAQGIALMVVAMLILPLTDGLAKYLSASYSPLFLGWARYAVACVVVLPLTAGIKGRDIFPSERLGSHVLRTVFLVTSMTLYFLAITMVPLATAVSTYFVAPVIAVVLSLFILKERMTWPKGISLLLGFAGTMIILQPGGSMEPGVLFALGSGVTFACYIIATRQAAKDSDPLKTLAFQLVVGTVLLLPQALWFWTTPAWEHLLFFAGLGLIGAASHMMSIAAFRLAEASTLAPLVYIELIGTSLVGYLAFGEIPGAATIIGAGFIIAAGLVLLRRPNGA